MGPGLDIIRCRVPEPGLLALQQVDLQFHCNNQRNLILHGENIVNGSIITLSPDVCAAMRIDQLSRDANSIAAFANAPLEHVAHVQLFRDLTHIHRAAFVHKGGISRDHHQSGKL